MMDASKTILPAKHRACIIAVYLGKFPGWFSVWLRSCEMNPGFDFLLLTDRPNDLPFRPANLRVEQTTLKQLKDRFSTAVGFEVALNYAFKICDFRPVFGLAFADLLKKCASPYHWHLVEEFPFKGTGKQDLRADGAIFDNDLPVLQGLWEAKDNDDKLHDEIKAKVKKGYPLANTLFQSPSHAAPLWYRCFAPTIA